MTRLIGTGRSHWIVVCMLGFTSAAPARGVEVDRSAYTPECGVAIEQQGDRFLVRWPMDEKEAGRLASDTGPFGTRS